MRTIILLVLILLGGLPTQAQELPFPYAHKIHKVDSLKIQYSYAISRDAPIQMSMGWIEIGALSQFFDEFRKTNNLDKAQMDMILSDLSDFYVPAPLFLHFSQMPKNLFSAKIWIKTPSTQIMLPLSQEEIENKSKDIFIVGDPSSLLAILAGTYYKNIEMSIIYSYKEQREIKEISYNLDPENVQEIQQMAFFAYNHLEAFSNILDDHLKGFGIK